MKGQPTSTSLEVRKLSGDHCNYPNKKSSWSSLVVHAYNTSPWGVKVERKEDNKFKVIPEREKEREKMNKEEEEKEGGEGEEGRTKEGREGRKAIMAELKLSKF